MRRPNVSPKAVHRGQLPMVCALVLETLKEAFSLAVVLSR